MKHMRQPIYVVVGLMILASLMGCESLENIGGECRNATTGEVLRELRDTGGELWPVEKHPYIGELRNLTIENCGVSVKARSFRDGSRYSPEYLSHPETGERIRLGDNFEGMLVIVGYDWY